MAFGQLSGGLVLSDVVTRSHKAVNEILTPPLQSLMQM